MLIISPVLRLLIQASTEAHDETRLRAQLAALILSIWILLPRDPTLPLQLRVLVPEHCDQLKWHDAETVVDALEKLVIAEDLDLHAELVAIRLVIARLGGVHSAMRLGRLAIAELQERCAPRGKLIP